jgi:2-polyprenyl-3-methyl-5-hydroxy-6-metoxy-1,4-benzoquinol methylase
LNTEFKDLKDCLACGSRNLHKYLDLGLQPLANDLKDKIEDVRSLYPLQLNVCKECWHSQLSIAVNPELLYKNYLYVSGTSQTLHKFFDDLAERKTKGLNPGNVLDIACNDGTFLEKFKSRGWSVYGVDPAENLRHLCEEKGINVQTSFFAGKNYKRPNKKFDLITCFNVLAHISNPVTFLKEAAAVLNDDGEILVQTSQRDMVIEGQFDTVYHEHHSFFSLSSFVSLSWRAGLFVKKVEYTDIHGGSYLVSLTKNPFLISDSISDEIIKEEGEGRYSIELYDNYTKKVTEIKDKVNEVISEVKNQGYKTVGFGAAAKGIVLLNYFGLNLDFVIDENDLKINKYIAGVDTLISDYPKEINEKVCFVILAWNFYDEIVGKIKSKYPNIECKFLKVFPEIVLE